MRSMSLLTYEVRRADPGVERQGILELWRRNLPHFDPDRYTWLYQTNPTVPVSAWTIASPHGGLIGSAGLISRKLRIGTQESRWGQAVDLVVDVPHRTLGPALRLERAITDASCDLGLPVIYAFPNGQSSGLFRRLGYHFLGHLQRWTKPLSTLDFIRTRFKWLPAPRLAAFLLDSGLRLATCEWPHRRATRIRTALLETFDHRFDDLWLRAAGRFPIIGDRSSAYLRWRFAECPSQVYSAFTLLDAQDQLQAYLVFSHQNGRIVIADLLASSPRALRILLREFSSTMRHGARALSLTYSGAAWVRRSLRRAGFWPTGREGAIMIWHGATAADRPYVLSADNWHLTEADRDA